MKSLHTFLGILLAGAIVVSCSSNNKSAGNDVETLDLTEIEIKNPVNLKPAELDSLALNADDLTPTEAIDVLMGYVVMHNEALSSGQRRKDLETIRKFVDVYDIVVSNHGKDMRSAIERNRKVNDVDLAELATQFRARLSDVGQGSGVEAYVAAPDTAKAATDSVAAAD